MRVGKLGGNFVFGWFLHAEPSRMKFGIIGLVVFIAAYVTSIVLYANSGVGREHQLSETMSASDGTTLTVDIEDIQSNNSAVLANLTVSPGPALLDPRTRNLKGDLSVAITSAATPTKRTWTKGMLPGVFIISLPIVGDVADWPFDRYRSGPIVVEIFRGNAEESERAPVIFDDSLPGWHVDMRGASKADPLAPYQLELHRSPSTAAFAVLILGVLITLAGLALFVAVQTVRDRRKFQPPMTTWYAAMLFAVIPLRNALTNPPPFGAWVDVTVVVWVIVVLVISMTLYIFCWWRHLRPEVDKPT
jgi:Domain of unknown function (DUF4436)